MKLGVVIQHHPSRAHLLPRLIERLGGAEVVSDPNPNGERSPMRCYRECLALLASLETTHGLIVQDDAWPCNGFREKAETAILERPETLLAFFVPGRAGGGKRRVVRAAAKGEAWAHIGGSSWIPAVAIVWPVALIEPFLDFVDRPRYREIKADDGLIARFVKHERREVWATVPSLVDHLHLEPAIRPNPDRWETDRGGRAEIFADSALAEVPGASLLSSATTAEQSL